MFFFKSIWQGLNFILSMAIQFLFVAFGRIIGKWKLILLKRGKNKIKIWQNYAPYWRIVSWSVSWFVGLSVSQSVTQSLSWSVNQSVGQLAAAWQVCLRRNMHSTQSVILELNMGDTHKTLQKQTHKCVYRDLCPGQKQKFIFLGWGTCLYYWLN